MGKKSTYNIKDAEEIVFRLSKGEPLAVICRDEWLPQYRTVYDWAAAHPEFAASIARARLDGYDAIATECLTIADAPNATRNPVTGEVEVRDASRDKLRVETRLKLLAKWDPKRYGERQQVEHSGEVITRIPDDQLDDRLNKLMGRGDE